MDMKTLFDMLDALCFPLAGNPLSLAAQAVAVVDLMIDFLRDERSLPNTHINRLMMVCWHVIGTKQIPLRLDPTGGTLPTLSIAILQAPSSDRQQAAYLMPLHWLSLVRTDPLMQLCGLVFLASQGSDYLVSRLGRHTPQRAQAYEAELLITLKPLMQEAQMAWQPNGYLQDRLQRYPGGLASLPVGLYYPPPTDPAS